MKIFQRIMRAVVNNREGLRRMATKSDPFKSGSVMMETGVGAGGYALLLVPATTFGLGCWQVQRRKWKLNLIQELDQRTTASPQDLPQNLQSLDDMEYCRIKMRGTFDHDNELYIGPRTDIHTGASGNYIITPFKVEGRDLSILVNRGWVSREKTNPVTRQQGQITDTVEIVGVVRKTEKRPPGGPPNVRNGPIFAYRDINVMAQTVNCAPVFVDLVKECSAPGGPTGGQTRIQLRNDHTSYIVTWYSLSAATLFMWYKKYAKLLKK